MYENNEKYLKEQRIKNGEIEKRKVEEDELIIEDNTIYEIDLDCYNCLQKRKKEAGLY